MKKHLTILALAMLLSAASAFAQDCDHSGTTGTLEWCLKDGTLTISGEGEMPDYQYSGAAPWSPYRNAITTVHIETGTKNIGNYAFDWCTALTSVIIPNSITTIGSWAFCDCFALTSINIPNGVTTIGSMAFASCSFTSITIPQSVSSISVFAFALCEALTSIDVESTNAYYSSIDGILSNKEKSTIVFYPQGKKNNNYSIPTHVTTIGDYAFSDSYFLTSIIIPNSVTTIGNAAFTSCTALTSIVIPNSVTIINNGTFNYCPALTSITIPNGVTTIGNNAFEYCFALTSITIPNSVTAIGDYAFSMDLKACSWNSMSITNLNPDPVPINSNVFKGRDVGSYTLKVPASAVSAYKDAAVWKEFNIVGGDYLVKVSANNVEHGYATGYELYEANATATVTATAYDGYKFVNWTKDGAEVSRDNPYSFVVTEDIELVANFEETVGIDDVETWHAASLRIYPNPTTGLLTICDNRISDIGQSEIVIYDVMGRVVHVETLRAMSLQSHIANRTSQIAIDISHLPQGVYGVSVISEGKVVGNGKVVKM